LEATPGLYSSSAEVNVKLLAVAGFISISTVIGFGQKPQTPNASPDKITLLAENEIKDGGIVKLRGHVEVITGSITVYADEADYNPLTGDLDARGHVHINCKKVTPSIKIQNESPEDLPLIHEFKK
jgi:lipopolysaccharide assembly outer membrane protein LptD (OstA)